LKDTPLHYAVQQGYLLEGEINYSRTVEDLSVVKQLLERGTHAIWRNIVAMFAVFDVQNWASYNYITVTKNEKYNNHAHNNVGKNFGLVFHVWYYYYSSFQPAWLDIYTHLTLTEELSVLVFLLCYPCYICLQTRHFVLQFTALQFNCI